MDSPQTPFPWKASTVFTEWAGRNITPHVAIPGPWNVLGMASAVAVTVCHCSALCRQLCLPSHGHRPERTLGNPQVHIFTLHLKTRSSRQSLIQEKPKGQALVSSSVLKGLRKDLGVLGLCRTCRVAVEGIIINVFSKT